MGHMNKLLNRSLKKFMLYAAAVLACSIPIYYAAISIFWQYELDEHNIILTPEAGREDRFLIIGAVTLLTVFFFILLLGGFILLNRKISKRLWKPFYNTLGKIRHFNLNEQKTVSFEQTDIAEFDELNRSLDKLIAGSVAAYDQQKQFADNASHELQTPLAVVQSKLEMLLQSKSLTGDQYNTIEEALKALTRVNRINKNLLLLTRIENSQFMNKEQVDLSALLSHSMAQFTNFSEDKHIALQVNIIPGVTVDGNKILIEILLNNLITNAIRHSADNAFVSVALSSKSLEITNTGAASLEPAKLFKRFATASSQTPGTGLGLAIVKQIGDRYGWTINYAFHKGMHVFSLHF
jgi:signal transduction histidine kinase